MKRNIIVTLLTVIFMLVAGCSDLMNPMVWMGSLPEAPVNPEENWAYYNTTEGKSYIWDGTQWQIIAEDGVDGDNGISIIWMGSLPTSPSNPSLNWAYYNTILGISYLWNGTSWEILTVDGEPGETFLLATYTGVMTGGTQTISIPEIQGRLGSTFVMGYWAHSTSPGIWMPLTDGWLNSANANI